MKWKEKMPAPVRDRTFAEYGSSREERPVLVDCALGTNPLGSPPWAKEYFESGNLPDPGGYPGDDLPLRKALSDSWNGAFSPDEIVTGTGSIGLIISLAGAFCAPGAEVLGVAPQFPDGPMHFQFAGASYRFLPLTPPEFDLDLSRLLGEMTGEESIVYVDRPHNPTGQVPPLTEMARLAEECREKGSLLVIDEAYGDFLPPEESALNLTSPSVVVLRSFSPPEGGSPLLGRLPGDGDGQGVPPRRRLCGPLEGDREGRQGQDPPGPGGDQGHHRSKDGPGSAHPPCHLGGGVAGPLRGPDGTGHPDRAGDLLSGHRPRERPAEGPGS